MTRHLTITERIARTQRLYAVGGFAAGAVVSMLPVAVFGFVVLGGAAAWALYQLFLLTWEA